MTTNTLQSTFEHIVPSHPIPNLSKVALSTEYDLNEYKVLKASGTGCKDYLNFLEAVIYTKTCSVEHIIASCITDNIIPEDEGFFPEMIKVVQDFKDHLPQRPVPLTRELIANNSGMTFSERQQKQTEAEGNLLFEAFCCIRPKTLQVLLEQMAYSIEGDIEGLSQWQDIGSEFKEDAACARRVIHSKISITEAYLARFPGEDLTPNEKEYFNEAQELIKESRGKLWQQLTVSSSSEIFDTDKLKKILTGEERHKHPQVERELLCEEYSQLIPNNPQSLLEKMLYSIAIDSEDLRRWENGDHDYREYTSSLRRVINAKMTASKQILNNLLEQTWSKTEQQALSELKEIVTEIQDKYLYETFGSI